MRFPQQRPTLGQTYGDHVPVAAKFKPKLNKTQRIPKNIKLELALLKSNQSIQEKYRATVKK